MSQALAPAPRARLRQQASHSTLLQDMSMVPAPTGGSQRGRLDAIVVPASRPASSFDGLIRLSAFLEVPLVLLCSGQADVERLAERVARFPRACALLADVSKGDSHFGVPKLTSGEQFHTVNGGRESDLSLKRNLGLMLARSHGWLKIAFVDDDITFARLDDLSRLANQLDNHQIAGMVCRDYPDNSVLCHARREAGFLQDNFVTGAVLGVHCGDLPLPFFPDIYNEDWFFFSQAAARRDLPSVGNALQAEYDPFADPQRARREEFGDLLAEGLFTLMGRASPGISFRRLLKTASLRFWTDFREARFESIDETGARLRPLAYDGGDKVARRATRSLDAAHEQLTLISPDDCVDFIEAWREDLEHWERSCAQLNNVGRTQDAMDALGVGRWQIARFGNPDAGSHLPLHGDRPVTRSTTAAPTRGRSR